MIHIFTTGGTIEGLDYDSPKEVTLQNTISIEDFLNSAKVSSPYSLERVFHKDSRFITNEDRLELAERITLASSNQILVTHGTLTMAETAKFLGKLGLEKTIVLVGALKLGTDEDSDAPFNLGFAFGVLDFLEYGVYVAMNGEVFTWDNVRKNLESNQFEKEF